MLNYNIAKQIEKILKARNLDKKQSRAFLGLPFLADKGVFRA